MFELFKITNSVINKQILKQDYELFKSFDYWSDIYLNSLKNDLDIESFNKTAFYFIKNLDKYLEKKIILSKNEIVGLKFFTSKLTLPFLDIYTLTRIFKQPVNGFRSSLTFGYFGMVHVKNIIDNLISSGLYEIAYDIPTSLPFRCKSFDSILNLSKEVKLHNKNIDICRSKLI